MELSSRFERWRELKSPKQSWGLAWHLAAEICKRFYGSHGLVPWVIAHDGLGYYGIEINQVRCPVNPDGPDSLGRLTIGGDVENWRTGSPGDHGLELMEECERGMKTDDLVRAAVSHLALEPIPRKSHLSCRHKRWGDSYVLCFEVATYLALQYEAGTLAIWNHPVHLKRKLKQHDPKVSMKEHPGGFLFVRHNRELLIAGDGRFLDGSGDDLWLDYMRGQSVSELAKFIDRRLDA